MPRKRRSAFFLATAAALLFIPFPAHGTDYYVSSKSGNDADTGRSPDAAWRSLARANHATFLPGDHILLHSGETWRGQLRPSSSGTQDLPIVYTSYGLGPRPMLEGNRGSDLGPTSTPRHADAASVVDVAIDNNDQSHIVYEDLEIRHVLEGLRIYVWSAAVQDITLQNSRIQVEVEAPHALPSAAVYANVRTGTISQLHILGNQLIPYPRGLEHWGIYFVSGVRHFQISDNTLGPAGEDGITIWHSAFGEISHNTGGGNGENTVDVKDSHDVLISDNDADLDREYNIVVHTVDDPEATYNVIVRNNRCWRGGQGGTLSAGIALLFVQRSGIENNAVDFAFGSGILIKDTGADRANWASGNRLTGNGTGQDLPAIVLQGASSARLQENQILLPAKYPR